MLHGLCFNYMWFDELHTKLHFNYEFKGLKLIETCKNNFSMAKFDLLWLMVYFW